MEVTTIIPVYDDWTNLERLLDAIDALQSLDGLEFRVVVVNDGSRLASPIGKWPANKFTRIRSVKVVNLICNLGHQRAIAVGLVMAAQESSLSGGVVVMDGDGEDRPDDMPRLIAAAMENPDRIVCARRAQRSDSFAFKTSYYIYKLAFRSLAGALIDFGNFCYIPRVALDGVVYSPSLWNHLAATLVRSRLPLMRLATKRGPRYSGTSRMRLDGLVAHGLSAISVYSDIVLVRIVIGMLGIAALTGAGLVAVAAIRLFSDLAIPGWASSVFGSLSIVLLQSIIFAVVSAFLLLSARSTKPIIPMVDAPQFIASTEQHGFGVLQDAVAS